ncbi:MAG TPA: prepilin-type N-terminal cleavage/methylation domain-containing protein [Patescibacteria group bacterium]|nr:prepilin-type N-terminal cleavage/methylation domain-containing protein [Patescibacteria group bacterium]
MRFGLAADNDGFSLIEVMLASAVFALLVTALVGAVIYGRQGTTRSGESLRAQFLVEEGLEAVRSIRDSAWNGLVFDQSGVELASGRWAFSGEGTDNIIDDSTRTIVFADVCRDSGGNIATCPAVYVDPHTKLVTVTVNWSVSPGGSRSAQASSYITNWDSYNWTQTNWSGGTRQSLWSDSTRYDSDDTHFNISTDGQVTLAEIAASGTWSPAGGDMFFDTTDTDFSGGSLANTQIVGSGHDSDIELTLSTSWEADEGSEVVTSEDLNNMHGISANDIWSVGDSGKILHYNGSAWTQHSDIGSSDLKGIEMVATNDGWAVGENGAVYHFDGISWTASAGLPGTEDFNDLSVVSASDIWAAGDNGKIRHYNGLTWLSVVSPVTQDVNGIDMVSASDGWAVGDSGKFLRWNGGSWSQHTDIGSQGVYGIRMLSSTDGWAVGASGKIWRWNGTSWSENTDLGSSDIQEVFMISSSQGWAVGDSAKIYFYNGTAWVEFADKGSGSLFGLYFSSSSSGWAVGTDGVLYRYGNFFQTPGTFTSRIFDSGESDTTWDFLFWTETVPTGGDMTIATRTGGTATPGSGWSNWSAELTDNLQSSVSSPDARYFQYRVTLTRPTDPTKTVEFSDITINYNTPTINDINGITFISESDVWAGADGGEFLHYDGSSWSVTSDIGSQDVLALDAVSSNNIWAVGQSGKIWNGDGTTWSQVSDLGLQKINTLDMTDASGGWAAGAGGKIYRFTSGVWSEFSDTGSTDWEEITLLGDSDGWLVGQDGQIYRYDGAVWTLHTNTGSDDWYGVTLVSAIDGWLVGENGSIRRWNGTSWDTVASPTTQDLESVFVTDANDGWAVGRNGAVIRWNGSSWSSFVSPTNHDIFDVVMVTNTNGWAVGQDGTILKFDGTDNGYHTSGILTSSAFDMGNTSPVQVIEWDEVLPVCAPVCTVRFQVRTASDASGSPGTWTDWYGASGTGTYFTQAKGSVVDTVLNGKQWVQYRALLDGDGSHTPTLLEVRVNYR